MIGVLRCERQVENASDALGVTVHTHVEFAEHRELNGRRVQLKCDGTWSRTGVEVKGKLANGVGSQYPSHYLGIWCIQHYYRWCAHLGFQ